MDYLKPRFDVKLGSESYRDGHERTFGKKEEQFVCKLCGHTLSTDKLFSKFSGACLACAKHWSEA